MNNENILLTTTEALNLFYALKNAGIIKGDEYTEFEFLWRKIANNSIHYMSIVLHCRNYLNTLKEDFFERTKKYTDLRDLSKQIYGKAIKNGGLTVYINTGIDVVCGYIVGEVYAPQIKTEVLTPAVIENYIRDVYDTWFKGLKANRYFLGLWYCEKEYKWYLCVSKYIVSKQEAATYCKRNGLLAFYDVRLEKTVYASYC